MEISSKNFRAGDILIFENSQALVLNDGNYSECRVLDYNHLGKLRIVPLEVCSAFQKLKSGYTLVSDAENLEGYAKFLLRYPPNGLEFLKAVSWILSLGNGDYVFNNDCTDFTYHHHTPYRKLS